MNEGYSNVSNASRGVGVKSVTNHSLCITKWSKSVTEGGGSQNLGIWR